MPNPMHDRAGVLVRRDGSRRKAYWGQAGLGARKPNYGRSSMAVPARRKAIVGEDVTADVRASEITAFTKRAWGDRCRHGRPESRANGASRQRESRAIKKHLEEAATVPEDGTTWEKMVEHVATLR